MVCREERKETSAAQPDRAGVLLAGAESRPRSARPGALRRQVTAPGRAPPCEGRWGPAPNFQPQQQKPLSERSPSVAGGAWRTPAYGGTSREDRERRTARGSPRSPRSWAPPHPWEPSERDPLRSSRDEH